MVINHFILSRDERAIPAIISILVLVASLCLERGNYPLTITFTIMLFILWSFLGQRLKNPRLVWRVLKEELKGGLVLLKIMIPICITQLFLVIVVPFLLIFSPNSAFEFLQSQSDKIGLSLVAFGIGSFLWYTYRKINRRKLLAYWGKNIAALGLFFIFLPISFVTLAENILLVLGSIMFLSFIILNWLTRNAEMLRRLAVLSTVGLLIFSVSIFGLGFTNIHDLDRVLSEVSPAFHRIASYHRGITLLSYSASSLSFDDLFIEDTSGNKLGINMQALANYTTQLRIQYSKSHLALMETKSHLHAIIDAADKLRRESYGVGRCIADSLYLLFKWADLELTILNRTSYTVLSILELVGNNDQTRVTLSEIDEVDQMLREDKRLSESFAQNPLISFLSGGRPPDALRLKEWIMFMNNLTLAKNGIILLKNNTKVTIISNKLHYNSADYILSIIIHPLFTHKIKKVSLYMLPETRWQLAEDTLTFNDAHNIYINITTVAHQRQSQVNPDYPDLLVLIISSDYSVENQRTSFTFPLIVRLDKLI